MKHLLEPKNWQAPQKFFLNETPSKSLKQHLHSLPQKKKKKKTIKLLNETPSESLNRYLLSISPRY